MTPNLFHQFPIAFPFLTCINQVSLYFLDFDALTFEALLTLKGLLLPGLANS